VLEKPHKRQYFTGRYDSQSGKGEAEMPGPAARLTPADAVANCAATRTEVGYVSRKDATEETYRRLGYKCGLEIHQQLLTEKKLFCHCPAGIYQQPGEYDAELVRHMRPTLSELGEYDGTALMEFRTRKNIIYRIANETACTYDIDDTPPFMINREAMDISIFIALMLKCNIVGELHITRKQYLDGSIPTGFQRTAIVGIEGAIPISNKTVRIIQISLEEDSCREISDIGHNRTYTTDRLGIPLIEAVTYPDMLTPDEAAEAGHYLRYLARASNRVRTGIGAARQDVNVSITGGQRVEIKGVAHIRWIPELTHNEAFRQASLLKIRHTLTDRIPDKEDWKLSHCRLSGDIAEAVAETPPAIAHGDRIAVAVNLPQFGRLLSHFTQPGRTFAHELSERLKVVACLDQPNMVSSEDLQPTVLPAVWDEIRQELKASDADAQILFWASEDDIATALQTLEERCLLAMEGVPNETRKSFPDGTTIFERVLPGPDRMYPDTDSAPIPVDEDAIERLRKKLPVEVSERMEQLDAWSVPRSSADYLLSHNLVGFIETIATDYGYEPAFVARMCAQYLKNLEDKFPGWPLLPHDGLVALFSDVKKHGLDRDILPGLLAAWYGSPEKDFEELLAEIGYRELRPKDIVDRIGKSRSRFSRNGSRTAADAESHWLMGQLRPLALGNIPLKELRGAIEEALSRG
jgi:glutamyl-tRNA(Gln) amidotransferase subunit E